MGKKTNGRAEKEAYQRLASAIIEQGMSDLKTHSQQRNKLKITLKQIEDKIINEIDSKNITILENEERELKHKICICNKEIKSIMDFIEGSWFDGLCGIVGVETDNIKGGIKKAAMKEGA